MEVLCKYPTRERPHVVRATLPLYLADPIVRVLMTIDRDDDSMNNPEMLAWLGSSGLVTVSVGDSRTKVEAINDGLTTHPWDGLLILASDDMIPQRPDYAQRIRQLFVQKFPGGDGVLHLDDGRAGRRLNTLAICDRKYFDRFNYLYAPHYRSVFVDNEYQEVSERLGRAAYVPEVVIRHQWLGDGPRDALMRHNESFYAVDGRTFARRQAAGFPNE